MRTLSVGIKVTLTNIVWNAGMIQTHSLALNVGLTTSQSHVCSFSGAASTATGGDDNPVEEDGS